MSGMYSVYMHILPNGKRYIGITQQEPRKRWLAGKGYQRQTYFYNAILKYGWANIEHEILHTGLSKTEAEQAEKALIARYKSDRRDYGYNIERGGNANKVSQSTREKLRRINLGKHHTKETREKLSRLERDRWLDKDYRDNQVKKRLGKPTWNKGKTTSVDTRAKQSAAKLGKYIGEKHWNSKQVVNLDTGKIYGSFGEIARELKIKNGSHVAAVCKGRRATAYGYHWAYA